MTKKSHWLVGHEPDLSQLAAELIGARSGGLRLRKAGLCHLRWDRPLPSRSTWRSAAAGVTKATSVVAGLRLNWVYEL